MAWTNCQLRFADGFWTLVPPSSLPSSHERVSWVLILTHQLLNLGWMGSALWRYKRKYLWMKPCVGFAVRCPLRSEVTKCWVREVVHTRDTRLKPGGGDTRVHYTGLSSLCGWKVSIVRSEKESPGWFSIPATHWLWLCRSCLTSDNQPFSV